LAGILFQIIVFDDGTMQVITPDGIQTTKVSSDLKSVKTIVDRPNKQRDPVIRNAQPPRESANRKLQSEADDAIFKLMQREKVIDERNKSKELTPVEDFDELEKILGKSSVKNA